MKLMYTKKDWNEIVFSKRNKSNGQHSHHSHHDLNEDTLLDDDINIYNPSVGLSMGKLIQHARISKGYTTQKQLAVLMNVRPQVINKYEKGEAVPDYKLLQKLRLVLNVKLI